MPNLLSIIKQAALEAVEAKGPMQIQYGTVVSTSPLAVKIDQKFTIPTGNIVCTHNVMDYKTKIIIDDLEKEITVRNGLKNGERVILVREQGGQRYIILDKVGG